MENILIYIYIGLAVLFMIDFILGIYKKIMEHKVNTNFELRLKELKGLIDSGYDYMVLVTKPRKLEIKAEKAQEDNTKIN